MVVVIGISLGGASAVKVSKQKIPCLMDDISALSVLPLESGWKICSRADIRLDETKDLQ